MWDAAVDARSLEHPRRVAVGMQVVGGGSSVELVLRLTGRQLLIHGATA